MNPEDPNVPGEEFERDVSIDKPGIVGARWWHRSLVSGERTVKRREVLKGLAVAGGVLGALGALGYGIARLVEEPKETVSLAKRRALEMQKQYGWDFGARGKGLVFDGRSEAPFVRSDLEKLPAVTTPRFNAKYAVATLVESLLAQPTAVLPDPQDGSPRPDAAPFQRLADVIVPVATPAMERAYRAGEALARHCAGVSHVGALVDLPGPEAVAFAAGACERFEPVLLFDNWPHPQGVVPSHLTLAALAYYQPRLAELAESRQHPEPLFVLDRARLTPYSEESDRFDNRYFARVPSLSTLAQDGITGLFYVVASESSLPEPADLTAVLTGEGTAPGVTVRALALSDFGLKIEPVPPVLYYGGTPQTDGSFWSSYPFAGAARPVASGLTARSTTRDYRFPPRPVSPPSPMSVGNVAVAVTASGLLVAAALDRRGSMNRFSGGWSG